MSKLRVGIVHHNLNSRGGGERVAVNVIELVKKMGFEVSLITSQKPDFKALEKAYNRSVMVDEIKTFLPFSLNAFGIYQRILTLLPALTAKVDLLINTHGDVLPYIQSNRCHHLVTYCHFPTVALMMKEYPSKYQSSLFWHAYYEPYKQILSFLMERSHNKGTLLTNSNFSTDAIQKLYPDSKPTVVYPCVDTRSFKWVLKSDKREDKVLIVSRFTPEKKIEKAITLAKILNIRVTIIGSLIPYNQPYFEFLKQKARTEQVEHLVRFIPNAAFDTLLNEMTSSKVYLHTMPGEHFGISIVEAMSAGLIPIVPDYGGCTEFVPAKYQYDDMLKMADNVLYALDLPFSERQKVSDIADRFSEDVFKQKMKQIIEEEMMMTEPTRAVASN